MALPALLGLQLAGTALGMIPGAKKKGRKLPGDTPRRHRRKKLTQSDIMELTNLKNILGKTAAANALPFYLGRR